MNQQFRVQVCFVGRVTDQVYHEPRTAFVFLSRWLREPGTQWVRVYTEGEKVFEWMRPERK